MLLQLRHKLETAQEELQAAKTGMPRKQLPTEASQSSQEKDRLQKAIVLRDQALQSLRQEVCHGLPDISVLGWQAAVQLHIMPSSVICFHLLPLKSATT